MLDRQPAQKWLVYPGAETYPLGNGIQATPLGALCAVLEGMRA